MKTQLVVAGYAIHDGKVLLIHHKKLNLWIPVGGHIDEGELPEDALTREFKEEVSLDVTPLELTGIPVVGNTKRNLATPFYANVHNVGDHDHACLYYVCKVNNPESLKINNELKAFAWFSKKDLDKPHVAVDVKNQALKAFEYFENNI